MFQLFSVWIQPELAREEKEEKNMADIMLGRVNDLEMFKSL